MFRLLSEILLAERPAVRAGRDGGNARSLRGSPHGDRPIQPVPRVRAPMGLDMGSGWYAVRTKTAPSIVGRGLRKGQGENESSKRTEFIRLAIVLIPSIVFPVVVDAWRGGVPARGAATLALRSA